MKKLTKEEMNLLSDQIEETVDIKDLLEKYEGVTNFSKAFLCFNPNHIDHTPSMHVHPSQNYCRCFACGETYGPVKYVMTHFNKSFMSSIRFLLKEYNITPCIDIEGEMDSFPLSNIELQNLNLQNTNTVTTIANIQAIKGNEASVDFYTGVLFEQDKVIAVFPTKNHPESESISLHKQFMELVEKEPDKYKYIFTPYHYNTKPVVSGGLTRFYQTDKLGFWEFIRQRCMNMMEMIQKELTVKSQEMSPEDFNQDKYVVQLTTRYYELSRHTIVEAESEIERLQELQAQRLAEAPIIQERNDS